MKGKSNARVATPVVLHAGCFWRCVTPPKTAMRNAIGPPMKCTGRSVCLPRAVDRHVDRTGSPRSTLDPRGQRLRDSNKPGTEMDYAGSPNNPMPLIADVKLLCLKTPLHINVCRFDKSD